MSEATLIASTAKLTRLQLADVPTPLGTATHRPVPHVEIVEALVETLSFVTSAWLPRSTPSARTV
jgi:hypothetical protein